MCILYSHIHICVYINTRDMCLYVYTHTYHIQYQNKPYIHSYMHTCTVSTYLTLHVHMCVHKPTSQI